MKCGVSGRVTVGTFTVGTFTVGTSTVGTCTVGTTTGGTVTVDSGGVMAGWLGQGRFCAGSGRGSRVGILVRSTGGRTGDRSSGLSAGSLVMVALRRTMVGRGSAVSAMVGNDPVIVTAGEGVAVGVLKGEGTSGPGRSGRAEGGGLGSCGSPARRCCTISRAASELRNASPNTALA